MILSKVRNSFICFLVPALFILASCFLLLTSNFLHLFLPSAFAEEAQTPSLTPLERGIQLLNEKKIDEAIKEFEEAASVSPTDPMPYYYTGVAYHIKRQFAPAIDSLNKALTLQPNMPQALLRIGMVLEDTGRIDMALSAYQALVETGENIPLVKEAKERFNKLRAAEGYRKAGRFFQEKQYEKAVEELKVVVSLAHENSDAYYAMGLAYQRMSRLKEAVDAFKKVVEISPNHVNAYMQLALTYEALSAYEDAMSAFQNVISRSLGSAQAKEAEKRLQDNKLKLDSRKHFEAAAEMIRKEQWSEALQETRSVLSLEPKNPNALFNLGFILYYLKDNNGALDALKNAIEGDPKMQKAPYQIGVIHDDLGEYKDAVEAYKQVLSIDDKTPEAKKAQERLDLINPLVEAEGKAAEIKELVKNEDIGKAIHELENLLVIKKDEPKLLLSLATLYLKGGRPADAASTLEKVLAITPNDTKTRFLMANIYERLREYKKASEAYKAIASSEPDTPIGKSSQDKGKKMEIQYHFAEGRRLLVSGSYEASLQEMQAIIELSPDEPLALFNMGILYDRLNRLEDAEAPLKKAVTLVPDYVPAYLQLGLIYEKLRKFDEARQSFEKVMQLQKEGRESTIATSRIASLKEYDVLTQHIKDGIKLMEKRDWDGARKEIEAIVKNNPKNYIGYYYLGIILDQAGIEDEAKNAFKKAIEINPSYAPVYLRFGDLLIKLGEYEDARRNFQQVLIIAKDSPEADMASDRLKMLKAWRVFFSMTHGYNSNIAFRSKAQSTANSNYSLALNYALVRKKEWDIFSNFSANESIYYQNQLKGNSLGLSLGGNRKFGDLYAISGTGSHAKSYFEGKPTTIQTTFQGAASTAPGSIPTNASLSYNFSTVKSFVNKLSNAEQHSISLAVSQKMSVKDTVTGNYSFSVYKNLDPIGSNYANRTNAISLSYSRPLLPLVGLSLSYSVSFVDYSNPDSTSLFQRFRRNVNQGFNGGISITLMEDAHLSFNESFSYGISHTNLPTLTAEEQQKLYDLLASPIPTVGGGGDYYQNNISFSLSVNF